MTEVFERPGTSAEVAERYATLRDRVAGLRRDAERSADRLGNVRLGLAVLGLLLVVAPVVVRSPAPWWGLLPLFVAFLVLGKVQDRVLERRRRHAAAERFFEEGLMRLDDRASELLDRGEDVGAPWRGTLHYADDLDLFGPASLFQLVSRAQTLQGRRALARDLAEPPDAESSAERRAAVAALTPDLDFRVELSAAVADEKAQQLDESPLLEWAERDTTIPARGLLAVLAVVQPVLLIGTYALYEITEEGRPLAFAVLLHLATLFFTRRIVGERISVLSGPEKMLLRYGRLLGVVEAHPGGASWLDRARRALGESASGESGSVAVRRLVSTINLLDARLNVVFALTVGPVLMWNLNLALRSERWRDRHGESVRGWFESVARYEVAASWASLAYERPDYALPEVASEDGVFEAKSLAHPLIARSKVVANDLELQGPGSIVLLSGSNMSGKSTLIRAVGLAVVMGRAGGPVPARALRMSPFELTTSVRVVDSLAEGTSHFYAELKRLKHVVERASAVGPRLLYLLDEVLHGTNSRERYIGAVSVIRFLSESGATGIVTTHDLALAELENEVPPGRMRQMHLADRVDSERIDFSYELSPGPIRSTNALRLMRAIGIDVPLVESKESAPPDAAATGSTD